MIRNPVAVNSAMQTKVRFYCDCGRPFIHPQRPLTVRLMLLSCIWLVLIIASEAAATPMRAVILFDTSGSMHQSDPQYLSRVAAQLFLDLTQPQDQAGLIAFSDSSVPSLPLTTMSSTRIRALFASTLRTLKFNGQTTNLAAGLETALASFPKQTSEESRDLVLLLTDGKLDLGSKRRADEPLALQHIRDVLIPQYRKQGIAVYTIAFTEAADRTLLADISRETDGEFRFVTDAARLYKTFSDLFILAKQAESIPMQHGALRLDSSILEVTLVLSKSHKEEQISLMTPERERLDATSAYPDVNWHSTPSYDRVQLSKPKQGNWHVDRPVGNREDIAVVGASTLNLQVSLSPGYLEVGEPVTIQARLLKNETLLLDPQLLQELTIEASLIPPEGQPLNAVLRPEKPGTFTARLTIPKTSGRYDLSVIASSPTLHRQRTFSFVAHPLCFQPSLRARPAVTVEISLSDDCPAFTQLELAARYETVEPPREGASSWTSMTRVHSRLFQARLPWPETGEERGVVVRIHARRGQAESFIITKGPLALPELPPPDITWVALAKTVGFQLLIINTILAVLGASGFRMYRYFRRKRS